MKTTFLTTSECGSADAAAAIARHASDSGFFDNVVVLSGCGCLPDTAARELSVEAVLGEHAGLGRSFFGSERLALALPFALSTLLEESESVVFSDPHFMLRGAPVALIDALRSHALVLASPMMIEPAHDPNPLLAAADYRMEVEERLFGVSSTAIPLLEVWCSAMLQLVTDPDMRLPSSLLSGLVRKTAVSSDVKLEGTQTLAQGAEYAELESRRALGSSPAFVDARQMWAAVRTELEDPDNELVEVRLDLLYDNVHDSRPLDLLQIEVEKFARVATPCHTRRDHIVAEVRRSVDPFGHRWPLDSRDLEDWLMEKNPKGVTRLGHLYTLDMPPLLDRFPGVSHSPGDYLAWHEEYWADLIGASLQDWEQTSDEPTSVNIWEALSPRDPLGWVPNVLRWRINTIKQVIPKYSSGVTRRQENALFGPDLAKKRGLNPPRAVPSDRESVRWPRSGDSLSLIGCFRSESGLGQAARSSLAAIRLLGKDFTYIDTSEKYPSRNAVSVGLESERFGAIGDVNLIHSNADEMLTLRDKVFKHRFGGRFNAAMWFWEPADLPKRSRQAFELVDELWVASSYLRDVFGQYGRVPVHNVGLGAELPTERQGDRGLFGLEADEFVFLFVYDALSSHGRKNPEKALEAFVKAFAPKFDGVRFVLKVSNLNKFPASRDRLHALAAKYPAISIIDDYFPRELVLELMASADVYISLHAAEGFGLTMLEAMALGTPTICTGYSGNMDFTTAENSWLVDYSLIATDEQLGPYPPGAVWASPSVDSAIEVMRAAANDRSELERKRELAVADAIRTASIEAYAARIGEHIDRVS